MPPPAPIKPQIKPTIAPQTMDLMIRVRFGICCISSFVVITGRTMNLMPSSSVMSTEKLPIATDGTRLETRLPTTVNASTVIIMMRPLRMSRFLLRP